MSAAPSIIPLRIFARRANLPVAWLEDEAKAGRVPHLQIGKRRFVNPDAVNRVLAERAAQTLNGSQVQEAVSA